MLLRGVCISRRMKIRVLLVLRDVSLSFAVREFESSNSNLWSSQLN
jgi:hypothetical protein